MKLKEHPLYFLILLVVMVAIIIMLTLRDSVAVFLQKTQKNVPLRPWNMLLPKQLQFPRFTKDALPFCIPRENTRSYTDDIYPADNN